MKTLKNAWTQYLSLITLSLTFLSNPSLLHGQQGDPSAPLHVQLTTEEQLTPLFLGHIVDDNSGFDSLYLQKLEAVLQFDLANNGSTQLLPSSPEKERLLKGTHFDDFGVAATWNSSGITHIVKVKVKEGKIEAKLFTTATRQLKAINALSLTGNLNQDRRQIHRLADTIHRALFGIEGIASTRILYTFKYPASKPGKVEWLSEIWEADYDGANARKVSSDDSGYCIAPCYIPPKSNCQSAAFLYVSYKNGQPKIYLSSLHGEGCGRLNYLRGNQLMPTVSRQRDQIAFISDVAGNPDLFIQEFNAESGPVGKPRQIFTTRQATQGTPTFSPDGKKIAFVSNKDGNPRIYLMTIPAAGVELKDIKPTLISRTNRESTAPSWSPDGSKLAYCARQGKERQIWIYDFNSDEEWPLTEGTMDKENPSWAPNSMHLTYNTRGKENADLYLININQRKPIKISSGRGEKRFPNWEPRS